MTTIAYPLLVLRLTGSAFDAGWVAFAATAPSVLAHMPAGALVDRWDPRRSMLMSEVGRGVAIAAVAVTLAIGASSVLLLIAAAVIEGVLEVFSMLAERRYVGMLVGREQTSSALVRMEGRTHVVLVVGRPLGGLLFGIGPIVPFLADVASFIYSVTTLIKIKGEKQVLRQVNFHSGSAPGKDLRSDMWDGLRWLRKDRFAYISIILFSIGTLMFQGLIMVFLADAHSRRLPALAIGFVLAASGAGGALGSAAASRLPSRVRCFWMTIQVFVWFLSFAILVLWAGRSFVLMALVMAVLGFTGALGNIELDTHLMRNVERDMLARVTSISRLMSFGACAVGPVIGGVLVQGFDFQHSMLFLFLATPILFALCAAMPSGARISGPLLDPSETVISVSPISIGRSQS